MKMIPLSAERKEAVFPGEQRTRNCVSGTRLKKLRLNGKLTLKDVARVTGLSVSLISRIENEDISPSIETLSKLAKFFGVKVSCLFSEDDADQKYEIIRRDQRKTIFSIISDKKSNNGYLYESFSSRKQDKKLDPFIVTLSEKFHGDHTFNHEGEVFIYVLKGALELFLENCLITLEEGDSIYLDASLEHKFHSKHDSGAIALGVKRVNGKDFVFEK
jgi:transcriptional regulator with XRE-family HTH domain